MTQEQIRVALENADGIPEEALRDAVANAAEFAPSVIAVAQRMADGTLPMPPEANLLRFGLHVLSVARETTACPAFLAILRRPAVEVDWLFGEDRATYIARLLLGLFDGNDALVCALAADREADSDMRSALLSALARLVWEGRASRDALLDLLDRLDRDEKERPDSFLWFGWQEAIVLLGLTDWTERVDRAREAGRDVPMFQREVDRKDWLERIQAAAEHPEDPQRFIDDHVVPLDDPVADLRWSATRPGGPNDALNEDEIAWLALVLWRHAMPSFSAMPLEEADGFLTALAAGPVRVTAADYLPSIWGEDPAHLRFDTPAHDALVEALLAQHLAAIGRDMAVGEAINPFIDYDLTGFEGALWARGYLTAMQQHKEAWEPLIRAKRLAQRLVAPLFVLLPEEDATASSALKPQRRRDLLDALPDVVAATWAYWHGVDHRLLDVPRERALKVGRNDPCPCGSGKKYKRCCGAAA